jgi:hypothetical protein
MRCPLYKIVAFKQDLTGCNIPRLFYATTVFALSKNQFNIN